ncbi:MAG: hemolysin activation/secretion protein, partial [Paracoccaceae bacterium]
MAIDLPPAVPPTLVNASYISDYASSASAYIGTVGSFELRVTGDHYLNNEELNKIFEVAKSPDQAILLINSATNRKGHLLVNTVYSRQQAVIYVHALQAILSNVTGAEEITPFFKGLEGDADLKRREFDRSRAMANIKSERTGVDYSVSYQVAGNDPGQVAMVLQAEPDADADRTDVSLKLSNEGSRFSGRYYADAGIRHATLGGTNVSLDYQKAIPEWGESSDGDSYDQIAVGINRPFSFGLYGLRLSQAEYNQNFTSTSSAAVLCGPIAALPCLPGAATTTSTTVLDAEIQRIALTGEQVLSSDINRRLSLFEELEMIGATIEGLGGTDLQDETYTTLELGGKYQRASKVGSNKLLNYTLTASAKGGISDDGGTLESTPTATGVAVGKRVGDFIVIKPRAAVQIGTRGKTTLDFDFSAQLADDQLPQQQQWVLGGVNSISSHLPGVVVGDSGLFARLGLNHQLASGDGFQILAGVFAEYGEA